MPHFGKRIFSSPGHGLRFPFFPYPNFFTASGGEGRGKFHISAGRLVRKRGWLANGLASRPEAKETYENTDLRKFILQSAVARV
jgi:hypothetical protein